MKHKPNRISSIIEIKDGKVVYKTKICPRCSNATFMARHKDRYYCGKCKYTEFIITENK